MSTWTRMWALRCSTRSWRSCTRDFRALRTISGSRRSSEKCGQWLTKHRRLWGPLHPQRWFVACLSPRAWGRISMETQAAALHSAYRAQISESRTSNKMSWCPGGRALTRESLDKLGQQDSLTKRAFCPARMPRKMVAWTQTWETSRMPSRTLAKCPWPSLISEMWARRRRALIKSIEITNWGAMRNQNNRWLWAILSKKRITKSWRGTFRQSTLRRRC